MSTSTTSPGPPRTSILADLVYWLTISRPAVPTSSSFTSPSTKPFTKHLILKIFKMICTEWLLMMSHVKARIALIEWELRQPKFLPQNEAGLHTSLQKLFPWRQRLPFYHEMLNYSFDHITKRSTFLSIPTSEFSVLNSDFESIRTKFQTIVNHSEKVLTAATAIISIEESKKATAQNKGVSRLTYIALTFAPLSFLSSFFSMTDNIGALKRTIWIYFVVAIPLTMVLLMIASVSKYAGKAKKRFKKRWKERQKEREERRRKGV
jgi:Mg2+ and Co2+ transporter CorA